MSQFVKGDAQLRISRSDAVWKWNGRRFPVAAWAQTYRRLSRREGREFKGPRRLFVNKIRANRGARARTAEPTARGLKQLDDESSRLKKLVADPSLDREMPQGFMGRKL
jgi:hypothetical protein